MENLLINLPDGFVSKYSIGDRIKRFNILLWIILFDVSTPKILRKYFITLLTYAPITRMKAF